MKNKNQTRGVSRPNILILCMDQWQARMELPREVKLPALERLEGQGVNFDRYYCTTPICTPSRTTMWTGVHAKLAGMWDNTNFAWIDGMPDDVTTLGHMLRDQGYYTSFKGKWHISDVPKSEDGLEKYGFSDYQGWGDNFGPPLAGAQGDCSVAFETVDWLEHRAKRLNQPWMLVSSLVNPHDIMFLETDLIEAPHPNGAIAGLKTPVQRLSWFQEQWNVSLPFNFADDCRLHPPAVAHYKKFIDLNYGLIPDDRVDLWLKRRNYFINAMRMVDSEFLRILDALDRQDLWKNTIVVLTCDHGDMNGAHRMTQKGGIHFDEAAIVNLTVCAPGGPQGKRSNAVGSHLDLAPTLLEFAGLNPNEIARRYPQLKGRSLKDAWQDENDAGPRGSTKTPGQGVLYTWDGLHQLDADWGITGALNEMTNMTLGPSEPKELRHARMKDVGKKYGAPDFSKRTFFRALVDGRYKIVRWFSPKEYGDPSTLEELYASSDVSLHDLVKDPGEMQNLGHPQHPEHDPKLVEQMLGKLNALIAEEIGEDRAPFDLDLFGTREVKYKKTRGSTRDAA
jgi:arylsulfatase